MSLTTLCIDSRPQYSSPHPSELLHLNQAGVQHLISNLTYVIYLHVISKISGSMICAILVHHIWFRLELNYSKWQRTWDTKTYSLHYVMHTFHLK